MSMVPPFTEAQLTAARAYARLYVRTDAAPLPPAEIDPRVEALVHDLIGRVADKWTMLILELLAEHGRVRFTRLSVLVRGISQKMLTQTLRSLERDGLVTRTVVPTVPVTVSYELTDLGLSLHHMMRGLKTWAEMHMDDVVANRATYDTRVA